MSAALTTPEKERDNLGPIYYHALDWPTNCDNPWALRAFVKMLAADLRPCGFDKLVYPVDVSGHITDDPSLIDSKARCVAMIVGRPAEERRFLKNWPVISLVSALGMSATSLSYQRLKTFDAVYLTADLASCVLDQINNPDEEEA